jgi:hypothetical protein
MDGARQLIATYGFAIDDRDYASLGACFGATAEGDYEGSPVLVGAQAIVDYIAGRMEGVELSEHAMTTSRLDVEGDVIVARTYGLIRLVVPGHWMRDPVWSARERVLITRGIEYRDRIAEHERGAVFVRRQHRLRWMTVSEHLTSRSLSW